MLREIKFLEENAQTVNNEETPFDIPMYFFISGDQESIAPGWGEALNRIFITYKHWQVSEA